MELTPKQIRAVNEINNKPVTPKEIVAFTFTEKAAQSMKERISKALAQSGYADFCGLNEMYVGTIHGFCNRLLREHAEDFKDFKILDTVKSHLFVTRHSNKCGMSDFGLVPYPNNVRLFLECIDKMVDDYENRERWEQLHVDVFEKYRAFLYERGYLDFSLLVFETIRQIQTNPHVADYLAGIK